MKVTDPVCGMSLDLEKAAAQVDDGGWIFFCSNSCHLLFRRSPERYAQKSKAALTGKVVGDND